MTMALGFTAGAAIFSFSNHELLQKRFAASKRHNNNNVHNKRIASTNSSIDDPDNEDKSSASPETVLVGSILDSVPESLFRSYSIK